MTGVLHESFPGLPGPLRCSRVPFARAGAASAARPRRGPGAAVLVGGAGGDRVYRDGGVAARGGRTSYFPFTVRVAIQMSKLSPPVEAGTPPGRFDVNTSVRPSNERLGCCSKAAELSGAPGFSGVDHGSFALRRVDTQRSARPSPPAGAPRWNQISFPSVRTVGAASLAVGWVSSGRITSGPAAPPSC